MNYPRPPAINDARITSTVGFFWNSVMAAFRCTRDIFPSRRTNLILEFLKAISIRSRWLVQQENTTLLLISY